MKTLAEFVQLSKKKPGSVEFASTGAGSASHLAGELFNQRAGIDMTTSLQGAAISPALQDLLGERVTSYFAAPHGHAACGSGRADPLATTGLTALRTCRASPRWQSLASRL